MNSKYEAHSCKVAVDMNNLTSYCSVLNKSPTPNELLAGFLLNKWGPWMIIQHHAFTYS